MTGGFNFHPANQVSNLKERSNSKDSIKKVIPIKNIKFPNKKSNQNNS